MQPMQPMQQQQQPMQPMQQQQQPMQPMQQQQPMATDAAAAAAADATIHDSWAGFKECVLHPLYQFELILWL